MERELWLQPHIHIYICIYIYIHIYIYIYIYIDIYIYINIQQYNIVSNIKIHIYIYIYTLYKLVCWKTHLWCFVKFRGFAQATGVEAMPSWTPCCWRDLCPGEIPMVELSRMWKTTVRGKKRKVQVRKVVAFTTFLSFSIFLGLLLTKNMCVWLCVYYNPIGDKKLPNINWWTQKNLGDQWWPVVN